MRKHMLHRIAAVLLAVVLTAGLGVTAHAAEQSASAADLRLDTMEGTVTLQNSTGRTLTLRAGMKLYNGYKLTTAAKSYAYVTLDSSKVVKLDAGTTAEIRKQGQKLELLVTAGQLFFNVKSPLAANESLNIRTSTMVTGIRGTAGYVSVLNEQQSAITLLTGMVQVSTPDAQTFRTATVTAGHRGVASVEQQQWQVDVQPLTQDQVEGFAAVEIARDDELRQRMAEESGIAVEQLVDQAEDRLKDDQKQAEEQQKELDKEQQQQTDRVSVDPLFEEPTADEDEDEPSPPPAPQPPAQPDPQPPTPPAPVTGSITLNVALSDGSNGLVADGAKTFTFTVGVQTAEITIAAGQTSGSVTLNELALGDYAIAQTTSLTNDKITANVGEYVYASTTGEQTVNLTADNLNQTVTVTNNYNYVAPTGSIILNVALSDGTNELVADVDKTFTFTVGVQTAEVTIAAGETSGSVTLNGLALGDYAIVQTTTLTNDKITANVGEYVYASTSGEQTVGLTESNLNQTITVTNNYNYVAPTGSITLNVALSDGSAALKADVEKKLIFTVGSQTAEVTIAAGETSGSVTLNGLALGDYAIVQTTTLTNDKITANVGEYVYASTGGLRTVTLTADNLSQTVTITNNYNYVAPTGSITLNVALSDGSAALKADVEKKLIFTVGGKTAEVTIAAGETSGSVTLNDLALGDYAIAQTTTLTNDKIAANVGEYVYATTSGEQTVNLTADDLNQTVTITNNYNYVAPTGSITLNVALSDGSNGLVADVDKTFAFTVGGKTAEVTIAAGQTSGSVTLNDLALGDYAIAQTTSLTNDKIAANVGEYVYASTTGEQTVSLTADNLNQTVTVTNNYNYVAPTGSITLNVALSDGNNELTADGAKTFAFTVGSQTAEITIAAGETSGSVTLNELALNSYPIAVNGDLTGDTITRVDGVYIYDSTGGLRTVTLTGNDLDHTVDITHNYARVFDSGKITLTVELSDGQNAITAATDMTYHFKVSDGKTEKDLSVSIAQGASRGSNELTGLGEGTYTITSADTLTGTTMGNGSYKGSTMPGAVSVNAGSPDGTATVTHTYVSGTVNLSLVLQDELNKALTTGETGFELTLAGPDTRTVTGLGPWKITDLPLGEYTITQTAQPNNLTVGQAGYTYTSAVSTPQTLNLTVDEPAASARVTNTYTFDGGTVTLTVQLQDLEGNLITANTDKTYSLWMYDPNNNNQEVAVVEVAVAANENSGTVKFTALPEGTYGVSMNEHSYGDVIPVNAVDHYYSGNNTLPNDGLVVSRNTPNVTASGSIQYITPAVDLNVMVNNESGSLTLDTDAQFTVNVSGQTVPVTVQGGSYSRMVRVNGLTLGNQTATLITRPDSLTIGSVIYDFKSCADDDVGLTSTGLVGSIYLYVTYTERPDSITVTNAITGTDLNNHLSKYDTVIIGENGSVTVGADETLAIPEGKTVQITGSTYDQSGVLTNNGTMTIEGTVSTAVFGELINNKTAVNSGAVICGDQGTFTNGTGADFTNNGDFTNNAFGSRNDGSFVNNGSFTSSIDYSSSGSFTVSANSTVVTTSVFSSDGTMDVSGTVTVSGAQGVLLNGGNLNIQPGGKVINDVPSTQGSYGMNNAGTVTVEAGGTLENNGDFYNGNGSGSESVLINNGTMTNSGYLINYPGNNPLDNGEYVLKNCSTITNNGIFVNSGTLLNMHSETTGLAKDEHGTITNASTGTFTNDTGGTITNGGYFVNEGTYSGNGTFTNADTNGAGTVSGANASHIPTT